MLVNFRRWIEATRRRRSLAALARGGAEILDGYQDELEENGLLDLIENAQQDFRQTVTGRTCRGNEYGFGGMRPKVSVRLYGLVRQLRPSVLVETGVCNGVSTAVILAAMQENKRGMLHSIDLPEYTDTPYDEDAFWKGKKGAAVPKGKEPGWLIPDDLRQRWQLTIGPSRDRLVPLLERLPAIDFFFHDSEHSVECMEFEYRAAWKHLRPGGILVSDDIGWNTAFEDFAGQHSKTIHPLAKNIAFLVR